VKLRGKPAQEAKTDRTGMEDAEKGDGSCNMCGGQRKKIFHCTEIFGEEGNSRADDSASKLLRIGAKGDQYRGDVVDYAFERCRAGRKGNSSVKAGKREGSCGPDQDVSCILGEGQTPRKKSKFKERLIAAGKPVGEKVKSIANKR